VSDSQQTAVDHSKNQGDHLSGKPGNVREFDSCQGNIRDFTKSQGIVGKNLVREKLPKTYILNRWFRIMHCCISTPTTDSNTSTGMILVTFNMSSAAEECRELSGKCHGIVREFHIAWRVVTLKNSICHSGRLDFRKINCSAFSAVILV